MELLAAAEDLLSFIQSNGSTALKLKSVRIHKRDSSGRALKFKFITDSEPFIASSKDLRRALGTSMIKSTKITRIAKVNGGYSFSGRGWGHGVGMCQDGARRMANRGASYRKILGHYYPGAKIAKFREGRF